MSALEQSHCLELLVADGGSTDGSIERLELLAAADSRIRIVSRCDDGPADALNRAFLQARGRLIGWLNADDLYPLGALARAVSALEARPDWLMVYGEGEEFDLDSGLCYRYPTLPPLVGIDAFRSHCFICQPTVVFRRTMSVLLGPFDVHWRTAFDFDYWLRAFAAFPERIGYIPYLQGRTRLHGATITARQRSLVALEATQLLARQFGSADAVRLRNYVRELQIGIARLPAGQCFKEHLSEVYAQAEPWLSAHARAQLRRSWLDCEVSLSTRSASVSWRPLGSQVAAGIVPFSERPFGVNLIGHAFEIFGIGEDIRMAARALQSAGIPCCVIHHPASNGAACDDRSLEHLLCSDSHGGPYAFNLVCMAAPVQARWLRQVGCDVLRERYTISSWPWETQRWPGSWFSLLQVTDELWPSSDFTASALAAPAAQVGKPLMVMPMAAEVLDADRFCTPSARRAARCRHGLPADAVLFGYGFDFNSTGIRKNPFAALEAFQRAFPLPWLPASFGCSVRSHPLSERVALFIKTFPPRGFSAEWHWLQARAAEDSRIHLIAENLQRDDLLALYGCCDVFLSLHRAEGFGRGMAEALQLGVDVIATGFGGNTDFCVGPLAHLVRHRSVPVPRGSYPSADGHSWAEPDVDHAAELCRQVASRRLAFAVDPRLAARDPSRDPAVLADYRDRFSFAAAGGRYRTRLEALWANPVETAKRLRWLSDRSPFL